MTTTPPGQTRTPRILVATDFSAGSRAALLRALALGDALHAEIHLLHVVDLGGLVSAASMIEVPLVGLESDIVGAARRGIEDFARSVAPGGRCKLAVQTGPPVQRIVDAARDLGAAMVVVGTHGRTGLSRLILGSVAERVARLAPCDVLVVRAPGEGLT